MNFAEAALKSENTAFTENGALAYQSTLSNVLDFFGQVSSLRGKDSTALFIKAYAENPDLAVRALLWARDARDGAGERQVFRENVKTIEDYKLLKQLVKVVPEVGRWDDLFSFFNTKAEILALDLIKRALQKSDSLCAKWMPRKGANAEKIRKYLGLTPKHYRKTLVSLTNVVETKMCSNQWNDIEYEKIPSRAHNIYQRAFARHALEKYETYKKNLGKGAAKINSSALYPHEVVKNLKRGNFEIANAQWVQLPNYIPENTSVLPMIDLSGSMDVEITKGVTAMEVAIALGLYTSTKNTGLFKDLWLNFSAKPKLYQLKGSTFHEKYNSLDFSHWGQNTNIEAAFDLILKVATENNLRNSDLPKTLIIFSDMQFDAAVLTENKQTMFDTAKKLFQDKGYELPKVVFWNLASSNDNLPVTKHENGAMLVSGFSASIMTSVLAGNLENITPEKLMLEILMKDRYDLTSVKG